VTCLSSDYTVKATFTDENGARVDPDSHEIQLIDPANDTRFTTSSTVKLSLGVFKCTTPIPSTGREGVWRVCWSAVVDGVSVAPQRFNFWVREEC